MASNWGAHYVEGIYADEQHAKDVVATLNAPRTMPYASKAYVESHEVKTR